MKGNPLLMLKKFGQSVWLDYISREVLTSGELRRLILEDGVSGVTTNPAILEKDIAETAAYDDRIRALSLEGKSVEEIYQALVVSDIQFAADELRFVYDRLDGRDGFVSLEVSPRLAHDTPGTVTEARKLWKAVSRPNIFIKVPATREGLPAIRRLIGEGINVNITLLFGLSRYRQVAEAYMAGLEDRLAAGQPVDRVASVASFFLSRIDVMVDPLLEKEMTAGGSRGEAAASLHGETALSCAKAAYRMFREMFDAARFEGLSGRGARVQRLLWASTGTKNPAYSDVKYVEPLIGPETINTVPPETLRAYRDHGRPAPRLEEDLAQAEKILERLPELGIDLDRVTQALEDEGIDKFIRPYEKLMKTLAGKRSAVLRGEAGQKI